MTCKRQRTGASGCKDCRNGHQYGKISAGFHRGKGSRRSGGWTGKQGRFGRLKRAQGKIWYATQKWTKVKNAAELVNRAGAKVIKTGGKQLEKRVATSNAETGKEGTSNGEG